MKINIENLQKRILLNHSIRQTIKKAVLNTLTQEKTKKAGSITLCFVNDAKIRKLNLLYLHKDMPTDVISFDLSEGRNKFFADIAVSVDTAIRNAKIFKTMLLSELCLYAIHGTLHLLGYNDNTPKNRQLMDKKAKTILAKLKLYK